MKTKIQKTRTKAPKISMKPSSAQTIGDLTREYKQMGMKDSDIISIYLLSRNKISDGDIL